MMCYFCKEKEAKIHFTQIVDNEVKKIDLCEACAKEKGPDESTAFAMADMLLGLGASQQMEEAGTSRGDLRCPTCGFNQADFKKTARLGCADCYSVFSEGLAALLKPMHKGIQHRGKIPQSFRRAKDHTEEILKLERELQTAILREDFEHAAILRDQLKAVRNAPSIP
jgi:protein arginine kinase activator